MSQRYVLAKRYTEKYKDVLLPCKHCGSKDIIIASDRGIFDSKLYWSVCCSTHACDCTGFHTSVREAVKSWNEKQKERGGKQK